MPPFLLTAAGRWTVALFVATLACGGFYISGHRDGQKYERRIIAWEEAERVKNAVSSGDDARTNPDRLRELDEKFCRDCK